MRRHGVKVSLGEFRLLACDHLRPLISENNRTIQNQEIHRREEEAPDESWCPDPNVRQCDIRSSAGGRGKSRFQVAESVTAQQFFEQPFCSFHAMIRTSGSSTLSLACIMLYHMFAHEFPALQLAQKFLCLSQVQ